MRTWRQRLCAGGLALVLAACAGPVAMAAGSYIDVPEGHWAAPYVEQAAQYHLMEGMGDGTFGMGQTLTRGQFAAALRKFFQWELVSPEEAHFSDVDPGQWYYPEVETALAHGVLTDEGDRFRPEEPITRQEMAELLVKALGFGELAEWADSLECPFSDVTEGKGYISLAFDFGMVNGTMDAVSAAALSGANDAITLTISLLGVLCLWSGVLEVMDQSGLSNKLAAIFRPLLRKIFPDASADPVTLSAISANISANLLGIGNAATPLGIQAARAMSRRSPGVASDGLCMLVVCNTASIQLIPTTVAGVRAAAGCAAPFDILPAVWLASALSLTAGICGAKLMGWLWRRGGK